MTDSALIKVFPPLDIDSAYYNDWSFRYKALLRRKNCLEAITQVRPTGAEAQEIYDEKNGKAFGYITEHITRHALSKVHIDSESAKELWECLKQAYENRSMSNQLNILTRLINLRMQEGTNLDLHYATTLDAIVSELRLAGARTADDEPLLTAVLTVSMPASFSTAVTAIAMSAQATPSYEEVRKKLRDHALSFTLKKNEVASTSTANVMMTTSKNDGEKNKKKKKKGTNTATNPNTNNEGANFGFRGKTGGRGRGRGRGSFYRGTGRPEPYPRKYSANFWVANNQ